MANPSNPNGANQFTPDERQQVCWDLYVESIAKGRPNALAAAEAAGYSKDQARNITIQGWFKERTRGLERLELVSDSEKVLKKALKMDTRKEDGKEDASLLRVQLDAAKHVTSTLGKNDGYSTRQELTGKDGADLPVPILGNVHCNDSNTEDNSA